MRRAVSLPCISELLGIYTHVQSAVYRLELCSTAHENAAKCSITMKQSFSGAPLDPFDVSSARNKILTVSLYAVICDVTYSHADFRDCVNVVQDRTASSSRKRRHTPVQVPHGSFSSVRQPARLAQVAVVDGHR